MDFFYQEPHEKPQMRMKKDLFYKLVLIISRSTLEIWKLYEIVVQRSQEIMESVQLSLPC